MTNKDIIECVIMASLEKNAPEMPINKEEFVKLTLGDYALLYNKCSIDYALDDLIRQGAIEERDNEIMVG